MTILYDTVEHEYHGQQMIDLSHVASIGIPELLSKTTAR